MHISTTPIVGAAVVTRPALSSCACLCAGTVWTKAGCYGVSSLSPSALSVSASPWDQLAPAASAQASQHVGFGPFNFALLGTLALLPVHVATESCSASASTDINPFGVQALLVCSSW